MLSGTKNTDPNAVIQSNKDALNNSHPVYRPKSKP